jgi:arylsulfatase A-like enzyme
MAGGAGLGLRPEDKSSRFRRVVPRNQQPNIVFILTDNHGLNLGCYGQEEMETPRIDELAEEGIRFTNVNTGGVVCTPMRSALLTGRYPERNGLYDNIVNYMVHNYSHEYTELEHTQSGEMTQGLDRRETTLGRALQQGGYRTGIVGKWDSGRARPYLPLQRGFDFFYGFAGTGIDYWTHERYGIPSLFRGNQRVTEEGYITNLLAREAVRFIEDSADEPFFLYVPLNAPGNPANLEGTGYQAPDEYIKMFEDLPGSSTARFRASMKCMDDAVGDILDTLDERGLRDDTVVVFASDGGGGPEVPQLQGGHGHLYEGALRIPCIARWPGQIPAGVVSDEFFTSTDLFPTFLSAAGVAPPRDLVIDGMNMMDVLKNERSSPRAEYFWQRRGKRAARVGPWKWLVRTESRYGFPSELPDPDARGELYNLETDPREQNDLAGARPELEREIRGRWRSWMEEMVQTPERGPFPKAYFDILGFGDGYYRL